VLLSFALPVENVTSPIVLAYVVQEVVRVAAACRADQHYMLHTAAGFCCFYLCNLPPVVNLHAAAAAGVLVSQFLCKVQQMQHLQLMIAG
jgi:hypothetical protein